jgi:hypothetical protein
MAQMKQDPLANDGVSCTVCHQIKPDNFGSEQSYSGHFIIEADSIIYGPYDNSDTLLMPNVTGYTAMFGAHMNQSELCATCHTLFTPFFDNQGNIGGYFPEQTPYLEWKNSIYPTQNEQCQDCHMPKINDPILLSGMGGFPPRTPFWRHTFVGGNAYMLKMLKDNIDSVGATAESQHFDSTIARAEYNLNEKSFLMNAETEYENDSLVVKVTLENTAGHKLPTGIPFRRMWIHLKVEQVGGPVIFESGEWDAEGKIPDYDSDYEPHYQVITNENEVQVYEGVIIDVDQQVTYTLLRASDYIKDNRIPPKGFTLTHVSYDSTGIFGNALLDPNFNKAGSSEGTGSDIVTYKMPALPNTDYRITVEVCYQSIKPELADHLRGINELDINRFIGMYDNLPNLPFIMRGVTFDIVTGVKNEINPANSFLLEQNYPNPFNPTTKINFTIPSVIASETKQYKLVLLKVYDVLGNEVATLVNKKLRAGTYEIEFSAIGGSASGGNAYSLPSGIYFYRLNAGGYSDTKKMILLH